MTLGLFADLYELTMAAAYVAEGRADQPSTFDLFVRRLPAVRPFLVACGMGTLLDLLPEVRFDEGDLAYLATLDLFPPSFLSWLADMRLDIEIRAVREGELVHANEPLASVTGPMAVTQLLETLMINVVGFETMVASKAALVHRAAAGRAFVDFSARRDHGLDAAERAARASFVGGASGTSLVSAARRYGMPPSGTMAHSYVMSHRTEQAAFESFLRRYGRRSVLLVDTYDVATGAERAAAAMRRTGVVAQGVRIDSGDLADGARQVRRILDDAGCSSVQILLSGDLDEHRIGDLVAAEVPVDAFGVGTQLGTSADAPYLSMVYKLVEQGEQPKLKLSPGKRTWPGCKQVWRLPDRDVIALRDEEPPPGARALLAPVWSGAARTATPEPLSAARQRCLAAVDAFVDPPAVVPSAALEALAQRVAIAEGGTA